MLGRTDHSMIEKGEITVKCLSNCDPLCRWSNFENDPLGFGTDFFAIFLGDKPVCSCGLMIEVGDAANVLHPTFLTISLQLERGEFANGHQKLNRMKFILQNDK